MRSMSRYARTLSMTPCYMKNMSSVDAYMIYVDRGKGIVVVILHDIGMFESWSGTIAMNYACV